MLRSRVAVLATALLVGSSLEAAAAPRAAQATQPVLTRAEFASSLTSLLADLEKASRTSWKVGTTGAYALKDVPAFDSRRPAVLSLVNEYRLWDGAGAVTHEAFRPNQPVTRAEVERVIRNLWALKAKILPGPAAAPDLTLTAGRKTLPTDKLTRGEYQAFSAATFGMMREIVRLATARKDAEARAAADAAAAVAAEAQRADLARRRAEARAAELARQAEQAQQALERKDAEAAAQAQAAREAQDRERTEAAGRLAEAERATRLEKEAQAAKHELARKQVADELRERAAELERIVKQAQEDAAREAETARAEREQLREWRRAGRFQGNRPLSLELSGLPWLSTTVPATSWAGPTAGARLALYRDDLLGEYDVFGLFDGRAAAYPGGPATLKAGLGPQGPVFGLGRWATLQLQPYAGGRADFSWVGMQLTPAGGPSAGILSHLQAGPFGLYGSAEAALPWTATGIAFRPTSTFAVGAEVAVNRQVAVVAGWSAEYGADWLPYAGSVTTGLQFGL
ncbi:MAG: hypothetical protein FJZ01_01170 [Candidatus Sericytochromatia bacterium]|nr:hypothetical protein [Candidatus Tanganyikabacteria bacterium]